MNLRHKKKQLRVTHSQLARFLGVSDVSLIRIERGESPLPQEWVTLLNTSGFAEEVRRLDAEQKAAAAEARARLLSTRKPKRLA
jgi:transcriptional regulator with XRE-family HTH domain